MSDVYMSEVEESLAHFGVKGMRWGVRRAKAPAPDIKKSTDRKTADKISEKHVSAMSNKQLKTLNERMRLEQEFSKLSENSTKKGKNFVEKAMENVAQEYASKLIKGAVGLAGAALIKYITGQAANGNIKIPDVLLSMLTKKK